MVDLSAQLDAAVEALEQMGFGGEANAVKKLRDSNASNALQLMQREGEAMDASINEARALGRVRELVAALRYALPLLKSYGHTQGDNAAYHAELIAPVLAAIGDGTATAPSGEVK